MAFASRRPRGGDLNADVALEFQVGMAQRMESVAPPGGVISAQCRCSIADWRDAACGNRYASPIAWAEDLIERAGCSTVPLREPPGGTAR
jgi:hypothetical protein